MNQINQMNYLEAHKCTLSIYDNGEQQPVIDGKNVYLKDGAEFEIWVQYFGADAVKYALYINDEPIGVYKGKEIPYRLSPEGNDVCDIHQNFYGKQTRWKFNHGTGETEIRLDVYPAVVKRDILSPVNDTSKMRGFVADSENKKTVEIQQANYKINFDNSKKETLVLFLKEKDE